MKKLFLLLFLTFQVSFSQNYKFAWITDTHIGSPTGSMNLKEVINSINLNKDLSFVIISGDISEKGKNTELDSAFLILKSLNIPYFIIPGNHDTKWSESGCTKFKDIWGSNKFIFTKNNDVFIGLNSGIPWRGGGGHVAQSDLNWLNDTLSSIAGNNNIYFFIHHPLESETDNWFKVVNILAKYKIKAIFNGHGHSNKSSLVAGIPAFMNRSSLEKNKLSSGYAIVENNTDSLLIKECLTINDSTFLWGKLSKDSVYGIKTIDSLDFINFSEVKIIKKLENLGTSLSPQLVVENKIFHCSTNGVISCFDSLGNLVWKNNLSKNINSKPAYSNGILAVATLQGDLYTLDAVNGEIIQSIGLPENPDFTVPAVTSQLNIIPWKNTNAIVLGTSDGSLLLYDLYELSLLAENHSASGMIETKPLFIENKIIFGAWDGKLYCIDALTGSLNWSLPPNPNFYFSPASCVPVTDGKFVYISTPDKFIWKIDILLGKVIWKKDGFKSWESIAISNDNKRLFVKGMENSFYIVNAADGKIIKEIKVNYGLDTSPLVPFEDNGKIIFGGKNGIIYSINADYTVSPILFMGTSRIISVSKTGLNNYSALNMDGSLLIFSTIKEN